MKFFGSFLVTVFFSPVVWCQPYLPLRIFEPIRLDGRLEEPCWQQGPAETDFMQADPVSGATPTEQTEVRIVYDDEFLFVGIHAWDKNPEKLVRSALERDYNIDQDDGIAFIVDTYNDKSTGLVFITNTLGARFDTEISADGGNDNDSFNTFWDAASQVDSTGYTVEFRIPFSSLRFEAREVVTMGFRIVRLIKRRNEYLVFPKADPSINDPYFKVSLAREMELTSLKSKKPFYITPYATANFSEMKMLDDDGKAYVSRSEFITRKNFVADETADKILSNIGLDAKYGLSKNFTLDFTLNTDFAQAEVDNRIINLSKYEVNLPEKRSFFLESRNYLGFSTSSGNEYFISRKVGREKGEIIPIISGVRVTGKSRGWQMGILDMQTKGDTGSAIDPHNFFVFRTRKDIDSTGSFAGGMITSRFNTGGHHTSDQTLALDLVKKLNPFVVLVGAYGISTTDGQFAKPHDHSNYNLAIFRSAREGFSYSLSADWLGDGFEPAMGFVEENDVVISGGSLQYVWKGSSESKMAYRHISGGLNDRYKPGKKKNELWSGYAEGGLSYKSGAQVNGTPFNFRTDYLFTAWQISDHILIPAGSYEMYAPSFYLNSPQKTNVRGDLSVEFLDFYGGKRLSIVPDVTWVVSKHFVAQATYEMNRIRFPDRFSDTSDGLYLSHLVSLNLSVFFSTKVSVKLLSQYDNLSNSLGSNLRFRYNPREGTDLYMVYNSGMNTHPGRLEPRQPAFSNHAVIIKFLKTFSL